MMNTTSSIIVVKGQEVCRPADWTDVAKFFVFNYGLHALTVLSVPGAGVAEIVVNTIVAIVLPFTGAYTAIKAIYRFARSERSPLKTAHKSGALCMVVSEATISSWKASKYKFCSVNPALTTVQGEHPVNLDGRIRMNPGNSYLVRVPRHFDVQPLLPSSSEAKQPQIACNYSISKAVIAIIQVGYSSYGLWQVSGKIIDKYGYGAYSLTVIPYILLSFVNLLANLCQPQYPSMFLVVYNEGGTNRRAVHNREIREGGGTCSEVGEAARRDTGQRGISGAVGRATGEVPDPEELKNGLLHGPEDRRKDQPVKEWLFRAVFLLLVVSVVAGPYLIIKYLTNFEAQESTKAQRVWLSCWLVFGQVFSAAPPLNMDPFHRLCLSIFCVLLVSPAAIGGFVIVAKMMLAEMVCTTV